MRKKTEKIKGLASLVKIGIIVIAAMSIIWLVTKDKDGSNNEGDTSSVPYVVSQQAQNMKTTENITTSSDGINRFI